MQSEQLYYYKIRNEFDHCNQHMIDQFLHYIETSQLICGANHLTGFYVIGTLVVIGVRNCEIALVIQIISLVLSNLKITVK